MFPAGCLEKAAELALSTDKPIAFDYYLPSKDGGCQIVKTSQEQERILYKSNEEYTSPLVRLLKIPGVNDTNHLLCETYNTLYFIHGNILNTQN
tara:strand:+ start:588 stop:869 length:282 start_codon:yes stop_codon:yes gene_type:complete